MVASSAPSNNSWFRPDRVDEVERRALPEFFDGSSSTKTPQAYTKMRNLIVATYREAPNLHLSVTECRRHLAADVGSVVRLHQFLEHWGIINHATPPEEGRPASSSGVAGAAGVVGGTSAGEATRACAAPAPATAKIRIRIRMGWTKQGVSLAGAPLS